MLISLEESMLHGKIDQKTKRLKNRENRNYPLCDFISQKYIDEFFEFN